MATIKGSYIGGLRTEATHVKSGNIIITDAPVDNQGKGEAFSPTDLIGAALASCMMTIMGIIAEREKIDMSGLRHSTTKHMAAEPRRIARIEVHFSWEKMPELEVSLIQKLKKAALSCPVALSLREDIQQDVSFDF